MSEHSSTERGSLTEEESELLSAYVDNELTADERSRVEALLERSSEARKSVGAWQQLRGLVQSAADHQSRFLWSPDFPSRSAMPIVVAAPARGFRREWIAVAAGLVMTAASVMFLVFARGTPVLRLDQQVAQLEKGAGQGAEPLAVPLRGTDVSSLTRRPKGALRSARDAHDFRSDGRQLAEIDGAGLVQRPATTSMSPERGFHDGNDRLPALGTGMTGGVAFDAENIFDKNERSRAMNAEFGMPSAGKQTTAANLRMQDLVAYFSPVPGDVAVIDLPTADLANTARVVELACVSNSITSANYRPVLDVVTGSVRAKTNDLADDEPARKPLTPSPAFLGDGATSRKDATPAIPDRQAADRQSLDPDSTAEPIFVYYLEASPEQVTQVLSQLEENGVMQTARLEPPLRAEQDPAGNGVSVAGLDNNVALLTENLLKRQTTVSQKQKTLQESGNSLAYRTTTPTLATNADTKALDRREVSRGVVPAPAIPAGNAIPSAPVPPPPAPQMPEIMRSFGASPKTAPMIASDGVTNSPVEGTDSDANLYTSQGNSAHSYVVRQEWQNGRQLRAAPRDEVVAGLGVAIQDKASREFTLSPPADALQAIADARKSVAATSSYGEAGTPSLSGHDAPGRNAPASPRAGPGMGGPVTQPPLQQHGFASRFSLPSEKPGSPKPAEAELQNGLKNLPASATVSSPVPARNVRVMLVVRQSPVSQPASPPADATAPASADPAPAEPSR